MGGKVKFSDIKVGTPFVCEDEAEDAFVKMQPGELSRVPDCNARRLSNDNMYRIIRSDELVDPLEGDDDETS